MKMNISDTGVNNKVQEYHDFVSVVFQDENYMSDNREISEYFEVYWQKIMELVNGFGFKYKGQWDCADTHLRLLLYILANIAKRYEVGCYDERVKASYNLALEIKSNIGLKVGVVSSGIMKEHPTLIQCVVRELVRYIQNNEVFDTKLADAYKIIKNYDRNFPYI